MTACLKKLKRFLILGIFFMVLFFIFSNNDQQINHPNRIETIKDLRYAGSSTSIHIDNNWTDAKAAGICTGSGTYSDPYIIEDLIITTYPESGILIENSDYYLIIRNCTIGPAGAYDVGIELINVNNSQIIDNDCSFNYYGIKMENCNNNTIFRNKASDYEPAGSYTLAYGIYISHSNNNNITGNIANYSGYIGIRLSESDNNIIAKNVANECEGDGIVLAYCKNCVISENTANHNGRDSGFVYDNGITLAGCEDNRIINNIANENSNGIFLSTSKNNLVSGNNVELNYKGIWLDYHNENNLINKNEVHGNNQHGIYLSRESNNNFIIKNHLSENGICIEETACSGNIYWDNWFCIYFGAEFLAIIIISDLATIGIITLIFLEIKRRKTRKF